MSEYYKFVNSLTKGSVVPGIILNSLLIYLVQTHSRRQLGTFRYLLVVFASFDLLLVCLHFLLQPKAIVLPGLFCIVLDFKFGSQFLTCLHFILFMISYAILILHLLYRYWVIRKPNKILLFSNPKFLLMLTLIVAAMLTILIGISLPVVENDDSPIVAMVQSEFYQRFGRNITTGWVVANYWPNNGLNMPAIFGVCFYDLLGTSIVITVISLAWLTYRHISSSYGLSRTARAAQLQLLTTVCVQTFCPLICVMIPYFCNMTLPIFGFTLQWISESTGLVMSIFPTYDPLAVIVLMKPYRIGFLSMIGLTMKSKKSMAVIKA